MIYDYITYRKTLNIRVHSYNWWNFFAVSTIFFFIDLFVGLCTVGVRGTVYAISSEVRPSSASLSALSLSLSYSPSHSHSLFCLTHSIDSLKHYTERKKKKKFLEKFPEFSFR